eukprot:TRINITY_DN15943_c0_g1_i1.p1 TRINITY_DN15943_c0_g1~~TRINITY_DN15943_c0_g1_i1.p1  ORF type:complete len:197 (-),score=35.85 TRINITY_DN15943_c0_g1_i1:49-639(-)
MRFKFCGDLDAPEWLLAEVAVLAKITSIRFRSLVSAVLARISGDQDDAAVVKAATAAKLDPSETKAAVAAVHYILHSAAKYGVDANDLMTELQQLGLPKEQCDAVGRVFREKAESVQESLASQTLFLPRLRDVDWRVDRIVASSKLQDITAASAHLKLVDEDQKSYTFEITQEKLALLLHELKLARSRMDDIASQQ